MRTHFGRSLGALVLFGVLLAGCGGSSGTGDEVLPDGAGAARAYTERYLREHPRGVLRPSHLLVAEISPAEGAERFAYQVVEPLRLSLQVASDAGPVEALVLRDARGHEVERSGGGQVSLSPGRHELEIRPRAGGAPQTVFVRPALLPDGSAVLAASGNCINCDFAGAQLEGQDFDGLDLSGSDFRDAAISDSTFRGSTMVNCFLTGSVDGTTIEGCDFGGANLTGSHFDFTVIGQSTIFGGPAPTPPANLSNTSWGGTLSTDDLYVVSLLENVTFANANLTGAKFTGAELAVVDFRGADLSGADFTATGTLETGGPRQTQCGFCDFAVDPSTGNATNLTNAVFSQPDTAQFMIASGNDLSGARLGGAQLPGGVFAGLTLSGADFTQANLAGAVFSESSFVGAVFQGADLTGTDLTGLDLQQARFTSATLTMAQLAGANLTGADLSGALLDGAVLDDALLGGALFSGATFDGASIQGVDLYAQDLHGLSFRSADLRSSVLDYCDLSGADLSGAQLGAPIGSTVEPASLIRAYMPNIDLTGADLRGVDLTGAHLYGDPSTTSLNQALLDGATLVNAICSGAEFTQASLTGAVLDGAQLVNCTFVGADLTSASFDSTYLQGADFSGAASVDGVRLSNAAVATMPGAWTFMEQNGMPFVYAYGATNLGGIATQSDVICPDGEPGPCVGSKLDPVTNGPFPPVPTCVPAPPNYNNCTAPAPPPTPTPPPAL